MSAVLRVFLRQVARRVAGGAAVCLVASTASAAEAPAAPAGSGAGVELSSTQLPATPRRMRVVYFCDDHGVPTFADRPCGSAAPARSLVVDAPRNGAVATTAAPPPRASTRPGVVQRVREDAPRDARTTRCESMQRQLDQVNGRMRAGYSAREAARLWQRWRELKERLHTARC